MMPIVPPHAAPVIDLTDERTIAYRRAVSVRQRQLAREMGVTSDCGVDLRTLCIRVPRAKDRAELLKDMVLPAPRRVDFGYGYVTEREYQCLFASRDLYTYLRPRVPELVEYRDACRFVQEAVYGWIDCTQGERLKAIRHSAPIARAPANNTSSTGRTPTAPPSKSSSSIAAIHTGAT